MSDIFLVLGFALMALFLISIALVAITPPSFTRSESLEISGDSEDD